MCFRIAAISIAIAWLAQLAAAETSPILEQFATADEAGRERLLRELVAGTDEHDYFHCLHYQNTRNTAALEKSLQSWRKRKPQPDEQRREIELREALLSYPDNKQRSLAQLREYFDFDPADVRRPEGVERNDLPSKLDPALITAEGFLQHAAEGNDPTNRLTAESASWAIATKQQLPEGISRRMLLKKIDRPDIPGLVEALFEEGRDNRRYGFGSFPIYEKLTLDQLGQFAKTQPPLLANGFFVQSYLRKLRPSKFEPGTVLEKRDTYLLRAWNFVKKLPPTMAPTQEYILRHRLLLDRKRGVLDEATLLSYLKLPYRTRFAEPAYLKLNKHVFSASQDLYEVSGLPKLNDPTDGEGLMKDLFLDIFKMPGATEKDVLHYAKFIRVDWLRPIFAEAKILSGNGDPERIAALISAEKYRQIVERIEIEIAPENPQRLAPAEEVRLAVDVKNVKRLTVKVFEINALNYFLATGRDLNTAIDLDGLIATSEQVHKFDSPPARQVRREFAFPQLTEKRGAWLIEFVGNGKSSRALVRKGELHAIPKNTAAGHSFRVVDGDLKPVADAKIWLAGREYPATPEKGGNIFVPYSTRPGRTTFVVTDGTVAAVDHFNHSAEQYELKANFFVDRESLIAGNQAKLVIRPAFFAGGAPADLSLLKKVELVIQATDQDRTDSIDLVGEIEFPESGIFTHAFNVPERLSSLNFKLTGEIDNLSTGETETLIAEGGIAVNQMERSQQIACPLLVKSGEEYSLRVVGKNGEPIARRTVAVSFLHRAFAKMRSVKMQSDGDGVISLGKLTDILSLRAETGSMKEYFPIGKQQASHLDKAPLHLATGEIALLAAGGKVRPLGQLGYSLLEIRGGQPARSHFGDLSLDKRGNLIIAGLPAGEYLLRTPDRSPRTVVVAPPLAGTRSLAAGSQLLERSQLPVPVGLQIAVDDGGEKVRLQVTDPAKSAKLRVHLIASHSAPEFLSANALRDPVEPLPRSFQLLLPHNRFESGREIGDEARYILERRQQEKFPGNHLPRPGLLLNPFALDDSQSESQGFGSGSGFGGGLSRRKPSGIRRDFIFADTDREDSNTNLDFLKPRQRSFYNLKPDANGVVEIELEKLGDARHLCAAATDGRRFASAELALPPVRTERRDRRLQKLEQLDPTGRFTFTQMGQVLAAGEELKLQRGDASRFEIYDSNVDAFMLLDSLLGDGGVADFYFLFAWGNLDEGEKRSKYSEFACHELNFFISEKDPKFFSDVVVAYLRNKRQKDFLDHYLLGDELSGYLEDWRLQRLNAAERALLARRLKGEERQRCLNGLRDLLAAKPDNYKNTQRLYEAALSGKVLWAGDGSFDFAGPTGLESIRHPLREIIIPEIDFTEATIEEAIDFFRAQAGGRINFVIQIPRDEALDAGKINLRLTNVSLEDALKFSTDLAGLKYRIDPNAVVIAPAFGDNGTLITKTFRVPPDFLGPDGTTRTAKELLQEAGIPFPDGASAVLLERNSTLIVRNTQDNLDLVSVYTDSMKFSYPAPDGVSPEADADPFAASPAPDDDAAVDDPFGAGGGGAGSAALVLRERRSVREFYRGLGDTKELAEMNYYRLPIDQQGPDRIAISQFWLDYAEWDGEGEFLSADFFSACRNRTEILMALAVLDLPVDSKPGKLIQKGRQLTIEAGSPAIVFSEQLRPAPLADEAAGLVIGQKFLPTQHLLRLEDGEGVPNYIADGFTKGTIYTSQVIVTNPTGRPRRVDLLRQVPHGAIPLAGAVMTRSNTISIAPYATANFTFEFYFPMAGKFTQYPAQISSANGVIATTPRKVLEVAAELGEPDAAIWDEIAARGSNAAVLEFLRTANLHQINLPLINWRLSEAKFFHEVIKILRSRQIYQGELFSYGLVHDDPRAARQFLMGNKGFLRNLGGAIDSALVTVPAEGLGSYQHLEYRPLVNARAHQLGTEPRITNEQFETQFNSFLGQLARSATPDADQRLALVYYLLLQDRVGDALPEFEKIDPAELETRLQFDHFRCYFAFSLERPAEARKIAAGYREHPVDRWRERFAEVVRQADQIRGAVAKKVGDNADPDREQRQEQLASTEVRLDLEAGGKGGEIVVAHRNLKSATLNLYEIDLEFIFSARPFDSADTEKFRFVEPNHSQVVEFDAKKAKTTILLPEKFRHANVLAEVVGGGRSRSRTIFSNELEVAITSNYGRLRVEHDADGKLLAGAYVKVYTRMLDGDVEFYKDGYTDLRGKFDYASLSSGQPDINEVERFAILVMHEEFGAVVKEITPPNGVPKRRTQPIPTPKAKPKQKAKPKTIPEQDDPFSGL